MNYSYFADDAVQTVTDARGASITFAYNSRHLVTGITGDPTTSRYFVDPNAKGAWHIRIDSESIISALLPKGRKPRREVTHDTYDEIDRVEASGGGPTLIPIPKDGVRQPQKYQLRLRNSRTNSIRIL